MTIQGNISARSSIATLVLALSCALIPSFAAAETYPPPAKTLKMGEEGRDVFLLQKLLNLSSATRVAETGLGSPGQETGYFGAKTFDAVKRFQSLYAAEILYPQSLYAPTGYVGQSTLRKLERLASAGTPATTVVATTPATTPTKPATVIPTPATNVISGLPAYSPDISAYISTGVPTPIPWALDSSAPAGAQANAANLEYDLAVTRALGKKQGMTDAQLNGLESAIRAQATSGIDFKKEFLEKAKFISTTTNSLPFPTSSTNVITRFLTMIGFVKEANAATGVPFGGMIYFAYPCTCSPGVWHLVIQPLPPSFPNSLSYITGSQLFLSYNLPLAHEALGFYTPATQACWMYVGVACSVLPDWGLIQPIVGSSPL